MIETKTIIGDGGRIVIPAEYRRNLGLKPGDEVILILEEGEVRLLTPRRAIQRAQALVSRYIPQGKNLAQELIQERSEEVSRG